MSTVSQVAREHTTTIAVINPGGDAVGARANHHATRLAAIEAATTAHAVVAATIAHIAKIEREPEPAEDRATQSDDAASYRHQSSVVVGAAAPLCCIRSTVTLKRERHGRCSPSNYHEWSLLMKIKLYARRLWEVVHVSGISYNDALEVLCAAVPTELGASLVIKATTKTRCENRSPWHASTEIMCRATL